MELSHSWENNFLVSKNQWILRALWSITVHYDIEESLPLVHIQNVSTWTHFLSSYLKFILILSPSSPRFYMWCTSFRFSGWNVTVHSFSIPCKLNASPITIYLIQLQWHKVTHEQWPITNKYISVSKISGFHGGDYEECHPLGCKNPVRTS
jgi:hypothetical protein